MFLSTQILLRTVTVLCSLVLLSGCDIRLGDPSETDQTNVDSDPSITLEAIEVASNGNPIELANWNDTDILLDITAPVFEVSVEQGAELLTEVPIIQEDGTIIIWPAFQAEGTVTLEINVVSAADSSNLKTIYLPVAISKADAGSALSFTGGGDVNVISDGLNFTQARWASDIVVHETNTQALVFDMFSNSHPELFEIEPSVSYPSLTLRFRPLLAASGIARIGVRLMDSASSEGDGFATSADYYFDISINAPLFNDQPSFEVGEDIRIPVNSGDITLADWACCGTDNNAGTQSIEYFIVENSQPQLFSVLPHISYPSNTLRFRGATDAVGTAQIKAVIRDTGGTAYGGQDTSDPQEFTIEFYQPQANNAPDYFPGPDVTVPNDTGSVAIRRWAENVTDNDGETQRMHFEILSNSNPEILIEQPDISYPSRTLRFSTNPETYGYTDVEARLVDDGGTENGGVDFSGTRKFRITTTQAINNVPLANGQEQVTLKNIPITFELIATDADNDSLIYTIESQPNEGSLSLSNNIVEYTPNTDFVGSDEFVFTATDGKDASNAAVVSISVTEPTNTNTAPIANEANYQADEDSILVFNLSAADANGDALTYEILTQPSRGTITQLGAEVEYTPESNNNGLETFTFRVNDGEEDSNQATITIEILPINDAPIVSDIERTLEINTEITVSLTGSDPESTPLTFTVEKEPDSGSYTLTDAQLVYTPDSGFTGTDTFEYMANDGEKESIAGVVTLTVFDSNIAPVALSKEVTTLEENALPIALEASDENGDTLSFAIVSEPAHGMLSFEETTVTYTPNTNYSGEDSFQYVANDGKTDSAEAIVRIVVTPVNDAPVFVTTATTSATTLLPYSYPFNATDADGDLLDYSLISGPAGMTIAADSQQLQWTPEAGLSGSFDIELVVQDPDGLSDNQLFSIQVTDSNRSPVITSEAVVGGSSGIAYSYPLIATDADGDVLSYSLTDAPDGMTIDASTGEVMWTPTTQWSKPSTSTDNAFCYASEISSTGNQPTVDFSVVIDHSGSMSGEHEWVSSLIPALEAGYLNQKIGRDIANQYGLVSYEAAPVPFPVGGQDFGSMTEFLEAAKNLYLSGGTEDGYRAVHHVLTQYAHRTNAAKRILLVTDEDRDTVDASITYDSLLQELTDRDTTLNAVLAVSMQCGDGSDALGINSTGTGLVSTGSGTYDFCENAVFRSPGSSSVTQYADLAFATGGTVWNLDKLRGGGVDAIAFSRALVDLEVSDVLANLPPIEQEDLGLADISHSGNSLTVQIQNFGTASSSVREASVTDGADNLIHSETVSSLLPGESQVLTVSLPALTDLDGSISVSLTDSVLDCVADNSHSSFPVVNVAVEDPAGAIASQSYLLISSTPNSAPVFSSTPITEAAVAISYLYTAEVTDQAGDDHLFTLQDAPDGMIINPYSGIIQFKPTSSQVGIHSVEVVATDLFGETASQTFDVTVGSSTSTTGVGPKFDPTLQAINFIDSALVTTQPNVVASSDLTLAFTLLVGPDECVVDAGSGEIVCTFASTVPEQLWVYVGVEDQYGRSDLLNARVNRPPVWSTSSLNDTSYDRSYSATISATDPESDAISYSIVSVAPDGLIVDGGTVQWTAPEIYADTTQNITLRATDELGGYADRDFSIVVHRNRDPVITNNLPAFYNVGRSYQFRPSASDADGDSLSYAYTSVSTGATESNGTISWTQLSIDSPATTIAFSADDGFGGSASLSGDVPVFENRSPVWSSALAVTVADGNSLAYRLIATDPDNDSVTYSIVSAPDGVTLVSNYQVRWTPTFAQVGVHPVQLKAADRFGGESEITLSVTVGQNTPPDITSIPVRTVVSGHTYVSRNLAEDVDNDAISFSLDVAPDGMTANTYNGGYTRWTPDDTQVGTHDVTLVASDAYGGSQFQSFTVEVTSNQDPLITFTPTNTIKSGRQISNRLTAIDPDGDTVSFELVSAPDGMSANTYNNGYIRWTPSNEQVGAHNVVLRAYDNFGGDNVLSYDITVDANGVPVFVNPPTDVDIVVGSNSRISFTVEDPDGDYVNLSQAAAPVSDNPSGLSAGRFYINWNPSVAQVGDYTIVLQAADTYGGIAEHTVNVTVHNSLRFTDVPQNTVFEADVSDSIRVVANHPEALPISYSLTQAPAGLSINNSGTVGWTPAVSDIGNHIIIVEAATSDGQTATTQVPIEVIAENLPPVVDAVPEQSLIAQTAWTFQISASDPEGKPLSYRLISYPSGMSVDEASGEISYTPLRTSLGARTVTIYVYDDFNEFTALSFTVNIADRANAPPVFDSTPDDGAVVNQLYSYTLSATDADEDPLTYSIVSAPDGTTLLNNALSWIPNDLQTGTHAFSVSVDDSFGPVQQDFSVEVLATNDVPLVEITSPRDADTLTEALDISGSVADSQLKRWQLLTRSTSSSNDDWLTLAEGTGEKNDEILGSIDPSLLVNGQHVIRLLAEDDFGAEALTDVTVTVEGDLKVGNFSFTLEDLSIPMAGIPIVVNRTYDSRRRTEALDFGYGWSIDYQNAKVETSRVPGKGWELNTYPTGPLGLLSNYCIEPQGAPIVTVTLPNGDVERFEVQAIPRCNAVVPLLDVQLGFNPTGDTDSTLEAVDDRSARFFVNEGTLVTTDFFLNPVDPSRYILTTRAGYRYVLDKDFGIDYIEDPNGNTIFYTDNGIIHSSGKAVRFQRDIDGRVVRIVDPDGNSLQYSYDASGDLTGATERDGGISTYSYNNNHGLLEMVDALGRKLVTNFYDDDGRLIAQEDENGTRTTYNHDISGKLSVITDRLGNTTTLYYDERGNVTTTIDALGNTSTASFDANDNRISSTDELGNTQTSSYNASNDQLAQTDELGNTTSYEYNSRGQETKITDPTGDVYESTYDPIGNLLSVKDPDGNIAGSNINAQGLPSNEVDALGNTTIYEYDAEGNKTKETDPTGAVMQYGYNSTNDVISETRTRTINGSPVDETISYTLDARGRPIETIDALGNASQTAFNLAGQRVSQTDPLGNTTLQDYDVYGNVVKIVHPDGDEETRSYDAENNLISETDAMGNTITYTYDALNRLVGTTFPDGSGTSSTYDAAGRVTATTDANGNITQYEHDAAGRRTARIDALGNRFESTYSEDGNLISETDALGNTTLHSYNTVDQRTGSTFADTSSVEDALDAAGRRTRITDQKGINTEFAYDANARLTKVTDVEGGKTEYSYDEAGNKISQTDALGRITRWTFDANGRVLTRTLPLGQTESFTYDAAGNMATHSDFNGQLSSYTYNSRYRATAITYADGRAESFVYDPNNNVSQVIFTEPGATSYTVDYVYDSRDRLLTETRSEGDTLNYSYDDNGNRTQVNLQLRNGDTLVTDYSFDALNQLTSVTDNNGNVTTYSYDANGNQSRVQHANGSEQTYSYDILSHLIATETKDAGGTVLQNFSYTLDATGRRTGISEGSGRETNYTYDDLYRLTGENISDVSPYSASYTYDAVGNRTDATVDGISTTYILDDNDRLISQGATNYTYDDQGNTLSQDDNVVLTTYTYNARNRLASVSANGITTEYRYNHNGARMGKEQGGTTIDYVVDENRDYSQVLVELNGSLTEAAYTYGDDLLSQNRSGVTNTYHYDGLGSTRGLTDTSGSLTDSYDYDAFGNEIKSFGTSVNDYRYTGEQYDVELDQYYLRARQYDQVSGRFTQMDSWMGNTDEPVTLHKYAYGNMDPANTVDPTGHFGLASFGTASSIRSTLATTSTSSFSFAISRAIGASLQATGRATSKAAIAKLRRCIRKANKCGLNFNLLIVGYDNDEMLDHIRSAQTARTFILKYVRYKPGNRRWYATGGGRGGCRGATPSGKDCDEYPFFQTKQGGPRNAATVSLRWVDSGQNRSVGAHFGYLARFMTPPKKDKNFVVITSDDLPSVALPSGK